MVSSVHLTDFPDVSSIASEEALVRDMDRVRDVCNAALAIRNAQNIRVRQPLAKLTIVGKGYDSLSDFSGMIQDEINVKSVVFEEDVDAFATFKLQLHFKELGKRLPEKMKQLIPASKKGEWEDKGNGVVEVGGEVLQENEFAIQLDAKYPEATQALSSNDALVVLDIEISESLKREGLARDIVRSVQQARKEADLHIADRINLVIEGDEYITQVVAEFGIYIQEQTLTTRLGTSDAEAQTFISRQAVDGNDVVIGISVS